MRRFHVVLVRPGRAPRFASVEAGTEEIAHRLAERRHPGYEAVAVLHPPCPARARLREDPAPSR